MQNSPSTNPMSPKTVIAVAVTFLVIAAAHRLAQEAKAQQEQNTITFELNKLEPSDKGCRAYIVVSNTSSTAYDAFKLDLVMFKTDGIIGRRFALNLAPIRPSKRSVKLFDLDDTKCEDIGSFLVNDVVLTREEIEGLMAGLLVSSNPPTGKTCVSEWLRQNASSLGYQYSLCKHWPGDQEYYPRRARARNLHL